MPRTEFDPPQRFVAGTVGPPGMRTFFLQARSGSRLYAVSLEKSQVTILADRMLDLLDSMSAGAEPVVADEGPLDVPIEDEFRVAALTLAWDTGRRVVVIECHDGDPDEVETTGLTTLRVVLTPDAARSFARRARAVVAAGRPACPFCGQPLDPDGHICPRANGYRR
ncbi:MAG: DUF3090 family protein [Tetrasphaera sp.]|jgi:uncharacterized repeat protein (TIGR03847 family)|nr:DUF3090 family protein [Tetrasphaera sp.]